jgi:hypothetical protein
VLGFICENYFSEGVFVNFFFCKRVKMKEVQIWMSGQWPGCCRVSLACDDDKIYVGFSVETTSKESANCTAHFDGPFVFCRDES